MEKTVDIWNELGFRFDCISTGFMVKPRQIDIVEKLINKVIAPCYSECANFSLLLGEMDKVEPYMRCAYKAAMLFDSAPTCKVENIKFCLGDIQNATTYDDLGESATSAVVKQITQENRNEELLSIWKKIAQEESCGGTE